MGRWGYSVDAKRPGQVIIFLLDCRKCHMVKFARVAVFLRPPTAPATPWRCAGSTETAHLPFRSPPPIYKILEHSYHRKCNILLDKFIATEL